LVLCPCSSATARSPSRCRLAGLIPAETAWYWSEGHQAAEREVDAELAEGRHTDFDDGDALLAHLDAIHGEHSE
jgi:hypothetical protein